MEHFREKGPLKRLCLQGLRRWRGVSPPILPFLLYFIGTRWNGMHGGGGSSPPSPFSRYPSLIRDRRESLPPIPSPGKLRSWVHSASLAHGGISYGGFLDSQRYAGSCLEHVSVFHARLAGLIYTPFHSSQGQSHFPGKHEPTCAQVNARIFLVYDYIS